MRVIDRYIIRYKLTIVIRSIMLEARSILETSSIHRSRVIGLIVGIISRAIDQIVKSRK